MTKANSVEAEIDEILETYGTDAYRWGRDKEYSPEYSPSPSSVRCQILSVVRKQLYGIDSMPAKMEEARFYIGDYHAQENYPNLRLRLTDDFFQALKNARRDGDESKNRV